MRVKIWEYLEEILNLFVFMKESISHKISSKLKSNFKIYRDLKHQDEFIFKFWIYLENLSWLGLKESTRWGINKLSCPHNSLMKDLNL